MRYLRVSVFVAIAVAATALMFPRRRAVTGWLAILISTAIGAPELSDERIHQSPSRVETRCIRPRTTLARPGSSACAWMVTTDHGGPNHSKLNLIGCTQELKQSRQLVPDVASVLWHGAEHAGDGSSHVDHSAHRDEWKIAALRHRKPVRLQRRLAAPIQRAIARPAGFRALTFMNGLRVLPLSSRIIRLDPPRESVLRTGRTAGIPE